ncbi:MAG TPA: hypothetical protein VEZ55_10605 [Chitinophagaceae bacterium]|nr:hypothetical protein [Chitinophagaceae bacterium]
MERIQVLLDKLQQQKQQNAGIDQMLITVQLLQNELTFLQKSNKVLGTSKVAVVMPTSSVAAAHPSSVGEPEPTLKEPVKPPVSRPATLFEEEKKVAEKDVYRVPEPVVPEVQKEPVRSIHSSIYEAHFEAQEAPTLIQQQIHKEIHELLSEPQESLNDRLNQQRKELAHILKEAPIKDLRKGIGVNDKFTFINELFRGDEAMYERSIKTINGFHILQEAEYWINRELKVKLGWNDSKPTVQHFYQLIRRRFS